MDAIDLLQVISVISVVFIIISLGISGEQAAERNPSNTALTFSLYYIFCISVVLRIAVGSRTAHIRKITAVCNSDRHT